MQFERLLEEVGANGRWQFMYLILGVISVRHTFMLFTQYGELAVPVYCSISQLEQYNWSISQQIQFSSLDGKHGCSYYNFSFEETPMNFTAAMELRNRWLNSSFQPKVSIVSCGISASNTWKIDEESAPYRWPVSAQFHLFCERSSLRMISGTLSMMSMFFGALIGGHLADKFGRRITWLGFSICITILGPFVSLSPNYIVYTILRTLLTFCYMPAFSIQWILVSEMFGINSQIRIFFRMIWESTWMLALCFFVGFAYLLQDWRWLHFSMNIPSLMLPLMWYISVESPRWLVANGRYPEALRVLRRIGACNRRTLSEESIQYLNKEVLVHENRVGSDGGVGLQSDHNNEQDKPIQKTSINYLTLMRTSELRKRTLIIIFQWFNAGMCYYGFSFANVKLPGNTYLNGIINALVGIPAMFIFYFGVQRFGRRKSLFLSSFFVSIFSGCTVLLLNLPFKQLHLLSILVASIGKFFLDIIFSLLYLYTTELFPTVIRSMAFSIATSSARIGASLAPIIATLDKDVWTGFPATIFAITTLIGGLLALLLVETANKPLLQTIEEIESGVQSKKIHNSE